MVGIRKKYPRDSLIIRQGDYQTHFLYIVLSGTLRVIQNVENSGTLIEIMSLTPGNVFGEIAIMSKIPKARTASVISDTIVELLEIPKISLFKIIDETTIEVLNKWINKYPTSRQLLCDLNKNNHWNEYKKNISEYAAEKGRKNIYGEISLPVL